MVNNRATKAFRLPIGGSIDRSRPIRFTSNGKSYQGYEGDTLASALLANGVSLTARSFKYHRPRGIIGSGYEEPASMVELEGDEQSANQPITTVQLQEGLAARSVNCWPSPKFDLMGINQLLAPFIPAAFYYKTFMWPNWRLFEPFIRRAAGLAGAPDKPPEEGHFETRHWHCDVLVAGAGPAGLMAALTAARNGARVLIADDGVKPGGSLLNQRMTIAGRPAQDWVSDVVAELDAHKNVVRLQDTTVWGYREHNLLMVIERSPSETGILQRSWRIRTGQTIIATGAIERPLVFAHNDRPGVMLTSAVQAYVNRYAVKPGQRAVVFTNNSGAYQAITDMVAAGIDIAAIVDARAQVPQESKALVPGIPLFEGHVVSRAHGHKHVSGVTLSPRKDGSNRRIDCDLLAMSGGWTPTVHLYSQSRGKLRFQDDIAAFVPDMPAQKVTCAGSACGEFTLKDALVKGAHLGRRATEAQGFTVKEPEIPALLDEPPYTIEPLWQVEQSRLTSKSFIDFLNDVTVSDVHLAIREGFGTVEHVKRYTTGGMGIDQGKTSNVNIIGAIATKYGVPLDRVGTTTFRSPFVPVEFGSIGGLREGTVVLPYRHTPMTQWNKDAGAFMYEVGARWRRPGYYPKLGESFQQTVNRESLAVRNNVAVYDGSPLGKFELKGRDVDKFLDVLYTNTFSTLKPGMGRYGIMLDDDGLIFDDGVSFKLGENHYLMSTSTGNADAVNRHMEHFLQVEYPEWDVKITTVTTQWANATICGPRARELLQALGTDLDLSFDVFPFMTFRDGTVAGVPARVVRVSFTGELSFEINVKPRDALTLWQKILETGKPFGIMPIGSEANHVLRVEKGFLSLAHEVDGTVDPFDLGMGWIMSKNKQDYMGKRSVEIRRQSDKPRRELVGLLIDDSDRMVTEGAPITPGGRREATEGFITACVWSVVKNRTVALALLENGRSRMSQKAHIRLKGEVVTAEITQPCFHDPEGMLLRS